MGSYTIAQCSSKPTQFCLFHMRDCLLFSLRWAGLGWKKVMPHISVHQSGFSIIWIKIWSQSTGFCRQVASIGFYHLLDMKSHPLRYNESHNSLSLHPFTSQPINQIQCPISLLHLKKVGRMIDAARPLSIKSTPTHPWSILDFQQIIILNVFFLNLNFNICSFNHK